MKKDYEKIKIDILEIEEEEIFTITSSAPSESTEETKKAQEVPQGEGEI